MLFQQVIMASLAFSSVRDCSIQSYPEGVFRLNITPRSTSTEISVERDVLLPEAWFVRVETNFTRRYGLGPISFPAVTTEEALVRTLNRAWAIEQQRKGTLGKCFTRLREREPGDANSSGSASPPPQQMGDSPRSLARRV
jgi:hypothetical protein